jgi:hypothetical protein
VIGAYSRISLAVVCAAGLSSAVGAQPPQGRAANPPPAAQKDSSTSPIVVRMMAFDKNGDGLLTRDEITDERLLRLFDRADTNKDGIVTKDELTALAREMEAEMGQGGGRGGPGGGFGGPPDGGSGRRGPGGEFGGPPGGGGRGPGGGGPPGGQRGMRGPGGPPQPGQILPMFLQDRLNLTADQKIQLQELKKEVDAKMTKILTSDQQKQLKDMSNDFGPPGRGGRGRGGPGGPRGEPPT